MLSRESVRSCSQELQKLAKAGAFELLSRKALRKGVNPKDIGAITQVKHISSGGTPEDRKRAAQIASRVRGFLRQKSAA